MSRLWNSHRLYAYMADGQITAVLARGWLKAEPLEQHEFPVDEGKFESAVAAICEKWPHARSARMTLTLGGQSLRYLTLPWGEGLARQQLREKLARALFENQFQQSASGWQFSFGPLSYGRAVLVACVQQSTLAALTHSLAQQGVHLYSVQPLLMVIWNHHHKVLSQKAGTLLIREGQRVLRIEHQRGYIHSISRRPLFDDEIPGFLSSMKGPVQWASALPIAQPVPTAVEIIRPRSEGSLSISDVGMAGFALYGVA